MGGPVRGNLKKAYEFIRDNPGTTSVQVAKHLDIRHPVFGMQRAGSAAIAALRKQGLVKDCPRCPACRRALSRHERNVPLFVTGNGSPL
jgi:hypothetical protein